MAKKEHKDLVKFKKNRLAGGETINSWCVGYIGNMMGSGKDRQYNGVLVATDKRVVFYTKGLFSEVMEEIGNEKISSVFLKTTLGHTTVTIHTSGNDLVFKSFDKVAVEEIKKAIDGVKQVEPRKSNSSGNHDDPILMLGKLSELHKSGVLSDEEFSNKKKEILSKVS